MEGLKHEEETEDRVISPQFSSKSVEKCHKCVLWSGRHHALFWARFINNTIHKILLILGLLPQALGFVWSAGIIPIIPCSVLSTVVYWLYFTLWRKRRTSCGLALSVRPSVFFAWWNTYWWGPLLRNSGSKGSHVEQQLGISHYRYNDRRAVLVDIVEQHWYRITFVQHWHKIQQ